MKKETIKTVGMHCSGCEMNAREFVSELPGVKKVQANHKTGEVKVEFDEKLATVESIKAKIVEAGYKVS
jgi:copper chaperone CopZ